MRILRTLALCSLTTAVLLLGSGCSATVTLEAAPDANNPSCADITVRLPESLGDGLTLRRTDAQATGAWGDPTAVILRCGVAVPEPTTATCIRADGIDWIIDESDAPNYVFTTYGRDPATEDIINSEQASGEAVLSGLASAIESVPATGGCVSYEDADSGLDSTESASAQADTAE